MWAQGNGEKTRDEGLFVLFVFFSKSVNFFLQFRRLFITDHCGPSVTAIDDYLALLREFLPRNAFFAVNCHGGDGRCTTSIVMMDIAFNATKVKTSRIFPALFYFFLGPKGHVREYSCTKQAIVRLRLGKDSQEGIQAPVCHQPTRRLEALLSLLQRRESSLQHEVVQGVVE